MINGITGAEGLRREPCVIILEKKPDRKLPGLFDEISRHEKASNYIEVARFYQGDYGEEDYSEVGSRQFEKLKEKNPDSRFLKNSNLAELAAIAVSENAEELKEQLMEAKRYLRDEFELFFKKPKFDLENKRLIGSNGYFLQWQLRRWPDLPESYENQQTTVGCVDLYEERLERRKND